MIFNQSLFNSVLQLIEESLSFVEDNISTAYGWSLKLDLKVQDIFDKHLGEENEIKYIIEVLNIMDCIQFVPNDHSIIGGISAKGYKFIFSYLHNIDFD